MAIEFVTEGSGMTDGDNLWRSTSFPGSTNWSFSVWIYPTVNNDEWSTIITQRHNDYFSGWGGVYLEGGNLRLAYGTNSGDVFGSTLSLNTWYHLGFHKSGGTVGLYLNDVLDIQVAGAANSTVHGISVGNNGGFGTGDATGMFFGRMAGLKIWNVAKQVTELSLERRSLATVSFAGLWFENPLVTGITANFGKDFSGNANDLTVQGTPASAPGAPVSWRITERVWMARRQAVSVLGIPQLVTAPYRPL